MDLWLRSHRQFITKPEKATHFYGPTKIYMNIPVDSRQDFWINYCSSISDSRNPSLCECVKDKESRQLGFTLKASFERGQVPIRSEVVIDLIRSIDDYVCHIIGIIQTMMENYFEHSDRGTEFIACYLRRDAESVLLWKTNTVEYAGKIVFPYAHVKQNCISRFYHFIINQLQLDSITPDKLISIAPINGLDTFIRPNTTDLEEMYGSTLDEDPPLKLFEIYGLLNTDVKSTLDLKTAFVPSCHSAVTQGVLTQDIIVTKLREKGLAFWLPLFFSSGFYDSPLKLKEGLSLARPEAPTITLTVIRESDNNLDQIERARRLIYIMSNRRAEKYWSWIDISNALHSIDPGDEGLKLWKWITCQSDVIDEDECDNMWPNLNDSEGIDIATLEYFAMKDNKEEYESFRESEIREALDDAILHQEHTPVAKAFKACFPYEFICANYDKSDWYFYNKHRWISMDGTSTLEWYINEKFQPKFEQHRAEITQKIANSKDSEFKAQNESKVNLIGTLIQKLSRNSFKKSLCSELRIYYHNVRFNELKDMNEYLMATPNGVIDLRGDTGIPAVRPGKPQDYITKSTRCDYPHNFTWDTHNVRKVQEYIRQVFRSNTLRDYFWRFAASLLRSGNHEKIFPIFSGEGNNSKSILVRLFEAAFGSYAVKLPTSLITERRTGADAATPALIHSRGAKVAFLQEPNKNEVIRSGIVKELTGHDTIYVRDLFQKGSKIIDMDITVVPILVANKIPVIPDCGRAIWERTRVINYNSIWTSDAPDDPEEQFRQGKFKMNKFFDREIPKMAPAFLWILVQKYEDLLREGLNDPPEVLEATKNFQERNNFYLLFTRERISRVITETGDTDMNAYVTLDEMFAAFRAWYQDQQYRMKIPTKSEFKEEIQIVLGQRADPENKWYGFQLRL